MDQLIKTGVDSEWSTNWGSEYDVLKLLRVKMGDSFPHKYHCAVKVVGIYISSGLERYEWYLIGEDNETPVIISTHACIKQISKSGKTYYQVAKKILDAPPPSLESSVVQFDKLISEC